ncbi:MAG: PHP domain-containing protein [Candidatus Heimdallarchaeota archaeon]|nr:PHP domain-containing protein [Candidatus Heimdallarchaeota archaeon]
MDLHSHSSFSDGIYSPHQLLEMAKKENLSIFSITDHDTVIGTQIAKKESENYTFSYLTGIEISSRYKLEKIEILGYNFNSEYSGFIRVLEHLQNARKDRIYEILDKLQDVGINISFEDVIKEVGNASSPGRPHFARTMLIKGYVKSVKEAFEMYLAEGKPAYVPRKAIEPKDAIELINNANGITVLPHPLFIERHDFQRLENILDLLVSWGLKGVEVFYNYSSSFSNFPEKKDKRCH